MTEIDPRRARLCRLRGTPSVAQWIYLSCLPTATRTVARQNGGARFALPVVKRCVGMFGDELPDFLFVGFEFRFSTVALLLGNDASSLSPSFAQVIDPRGTDGVFFGNILTADTSIAIF